MASKRVALLSWFPWAPSLRWRMGLTVKSSRHGGQVALDVPDDGEPAVHDGVDREQLPVEKRGRLLVTVGHHLAARFEAVDVGAAPGDDNAVGHRQTVVCPGQTAVHFGQGLVPVASRKARVVVVAVPQTVCLKQGIGGKAVARDDALPVAGNGFGVVQGAEGVDVDIEFALLQPQPYVLDKARTQQQQVLPVVQVAEVSRRFDDGSEIHDFAQFVSSKIAIFLPNIRQMNL